MAYDIKNNSDVKIGYDTTKQQLKDYFKQEMDEIKPEK